MLSLMELYKHTASSKKKLVYQRLVETFKFSFAERTWLGDPECSGDKICQNITDEIKDRQNKLFEWVHELCLWFIFSPFSPSCSSNYVLEIKGKIVDNQAFNYTYYGPHFDSVEDSGTSHLSVLSPVGDAVSVTTLVPACHNVVVPATRMHAPHYNISPTAYVHVFLL